MKKVSAVILASGNSERFGQDKLSYVVDSKSMIEHTLGRVSGVFSEVTVVSGNRNILALAEKYGFRAVFNGDETDDISKTIRLGMENISDDADGVSLIVSDQPYMKKQTLEKLVSAFEKNSDKIIRLYYGGRPGNPCIFPRKYFAELENLLPGQPGRAVVSNHENEIVRVYAENETELDDIDSVSDIH